MTNLESYIINLSAIKRSKMGVKETSYYGSLESFLNSIGALLHPSVRAIINTKSLGAGIPDGGLFTKDQFSKTQEKIEDFIATPPSRGVMEVKGADEKIDVIANSVQVKKYLEKYRQVLVTNYYQFQLVVINDRQEVVFLERYDLAGNEKDFWIKCDKPNEIVAEHEDRLTQYLMRVMLRPSSLTEPKDVAWFMASYAREARTKIANVDLPALLDVKNALEESIGISFSEKKGDHFFRSTLIQTIFYGIFSSWVLFNKDKNVGDSKYDWKLAGWYLKVPMIKALFDRIANPSQLGKLGLVEILNWTTDVLNRIEKQTFFEKFEETQAVLYFYEPFLEAFDKDLRKEMGVWYTPPEVVHYMVEKVDRALKTQLNIKLGLADENVFVLDPACGTGAFLVEVIKRIYTTLKENGADALTIEDLKEATLKRIFGFEILPAPFIVTHLQVGILLESFGVSFINDADRIGVYLSNALTGWESAKEKGKQLLAFPELQEEKDAAEQVKRREPILVIIGNPPYNGFASIDSKEEEGLVDLYKENLISKWGIRKFNLNELYVRFLRIAERKILKQGQGIICYVSSSTYTYKESFVELRSRFFKNFSTIHIDSLNGDSRETGKTTPDGKPDPSIFSTKYNPAGIKVGAAIGLFVKNKELTKNASVFYRDFWGTGKIKLLLQNLKDKDKSNPYIKRTPNKNNLFSFKYSSINSEYQNWFPLDQLSLISPFQGLDEDRKFDLISLEKEVLSSKIKKYFDKKISINDLKQELPGLTNTTKSFHAELARKKLLKEDIFREENLVNYSFRAFDNRTCYHSIINPLWNRSRPELKTQVFSENRFFVLRKSSSSENEGKPFFITRSLFARDAIKGHAIAIPFKVKSDDFKTDNFSMFDTQTIDNVSPSISNYLKSLGIEDTSIIFFHALSIGYSSKYLLENQQNIKLAFPKIPLPKSKELLLNSSALGEKISNLLDNEVEIEGVTTLLNSFQKTIAVITKNRTDYMNSADLIIKANWGNKTVQGIMPGKGKINERVYSEEEYGAFIDAGISKEVLHLLLGKTTIDVYLNESVYWKNIPIQVWNYHIGGYQVIKKWLSYRESSIIERALKKDEVRDVANIARRIVSLILLESELDLNYASIKEDALYQNK